MAIQLQERRYHLRSTGFSSGRYGVCEICGQYAWEVFIQCVVTPFIRHDGSQGNRYEATQFGHKECLENWRQQGGNNE